MSKEKILEALSQGDMRTTGAADRVAALLTKDQELFDVVFGAIGSEDEGLAMRSADAVEKASRDNRLLLKNCGDGLIAYLEDSKQQEVLWHVVQMLERVALSRAQQLKAFKLLEKVYKTTESRIVKTSSLQTLVFITRGNEALRDRASVLLEEAKGSSIPSVRARAKQLTVL